MWTQKAFQVQADLLGSKTVLCYEKHCTLAKEFKEKLKLLRSEYKTDVMKQLNFAENVDYDIDIFKDPQTLKFTATMKDISSKCTKSMKDIVSDLITESVNLMIPSTPPCAFSVVVIGSMARGEATPYSDLEYMFLIERNTPDIVDYFKTLALTTYFLIGNLRETKLSHMDIKELHGLVDDRSQNGFKIDGLAPGASNIPTGRDTPESRLILTPSELISRYQKLNNDPNPTEAIRGDLTAMIAYMDSIFFHPKRKYAEECPLLKEVKDVIMKMEVTDQREEANTKMLLNDLKKFHFRPDPSLRANGYTVDIKKEIFRFPSILLLNLAILHRSDRKSSWDTISFLKDKGVLSDITQEILRFLLSCACFVRLSAYLVQDSHNDSMSVAQTLQGSSSTNDRCISENQRWHAPFSLFFVMCKHLIPLKNRLQMGTKKQDFMQITNVGEFTSAQELEVFIDCGRISEALGRIERKFGENITSQPELGFQNPREEMSKMAEVFSHSSYCEAAIKLFTEIEKKGNKLTREEFLCLSKCQILLSQPTKLGNIEDKTAEECFWLGVESRICQFYDNATQHLVNSQKSPAGDQPEQYPGAEIPCEEHLKSLEIVRKSRSILTLVELSINYSRRHNMTQEAIKCGLEALEMTERLFGKETASLEIIRVCNRLGIEYARINHFEEALRYFKKHLEASKILYKRAHECTALSLNNIGFCYSKMRQFKESLDCLNQAIKMYTYLGLDCNAFTAKAYHSLSCCYEGMGRFSEALEECKKSIDIYNKIIDSYKERKPHQRSLRQSEEQYSNLQKKLNVSTNCHYYVL